MFRYLFLIILPIFLYANIGKITSIRGEVLIIRDNNKINAKLGSTLEKKDFIKTSKKAKVQIVFTDKTIFTVGKNSTLDISEYLYDEAKPSNNKAQFNVLKGAFSSITGRIGKLNKNKFKLKTKSAAIGLRGTTIKANQDIITCTNGAISVTTSNGATVRVEAGEKTIVSSGTPTKPSAITRSDIIAIGIDEIEKEKKDDDGKKPDLGNLGDDKTISKKTKSEIDNNSEIIPKNNLVGDDIQKIQKTIDDDKGKKKVIKQVKNSNSLYTAMSIDKAGEVSDTNIDFIKSDGRVSLPSDSPLSMSDDSGNKISSSMNEIINWGYWDSDPSKKWVGGQATKSSYIDQLRNSSSTVNANYSGKVMGTTSSGGDIKMDSSNSVKMDFKLGGGQNTMEGSIGFKTTGGQKWDTKFRGTTVGDSNRFQNSSSSGSVTGTTSGITSINQQSGNVKGQFFGPNAEAVGGTFEFNTQDKNKATGVFKATQ